MPTRSYGASPLLIRPEERDSQEFRGESGRSGRWKIFWRLLMQAPSPARCGHLPASLKRSGNLCKSQGWWAHLVDPTGKGRSMGGAAMSNHCGVAEARRRRAKDGGPDFHQLEPGRRLAQADGRAPASRRSNRVNNLLSRGSSTPTASGKVNCPPPAVNLSERS